MKRLLYVFVILLAFSACENDYEYTFDKTPTERKTEAKAELTGLLSASEFGWKTTIVVHGSKVSAGDFFVMKFEPSEGNNNGEVTIANGFASEVSEFEVIHEAGVILNFNTYNTVFHWLTKPNSWEGTGFGSDQEYIFLRAENDKLYFQGKDRKYELVLEKATEQDWDMSDIQASYDKFFEEFEPNFVAIKVTKGLRASEEKPLFIKFAFDDVYLTRSVLPEKKGFYYAFVYEEEGEKVYGREGAFVFTHDAIILSEPVVLAGDTLNKLVYNKEIDVWEVDNEGVVGSILGSDLPLMPSPGAVDNLLNIFLADEDGWQIAPWNFGDEGKMEEFAEGIWQECEMFDWFVVHANYTTPDGVNLGAGFELQADDYGDNYAFIPIEFVKLAESELQIVRKGDIVSNIDGAEEVIATDPNIQAMMNAFCNEKGWSIYCQPFYYTPDWQIFPYEFYNMDDPSIILKHVWGIW